MDETMYKNDVNELQEDTGDGEDHGKAVVDGKRETRRVGGLPLYYFSTFRVTMSFWIALCIGDVHS